VLFRRFLALATALAPRFHRTSEPMDDLVQVACIGGEIGAIAIALAGASFDATSWHRRRPRA
jgi:DNA-directed RNA polymerase specialized sigma subunit